MNNNNIRKVVIVGGGTAGWMAAAALSKVMKNRFCDIELVESESIGTVGVGEATIPQIQVFNRMLGLNEDEFLRKTCGTFKLGIQFVDWGRKGDSYIHAFGEVGRDMEGIPFYHYWLKEHLRGGSQDIGEYTLTALAALRGRFMRSVDAGNSPLSNIAYAFHFDAGLYAQFLREYAEQRGVVRSEGVVTKAQLHPDSGFIESIHLDDGRIIEGDLFIDCSGFRGLLIGETLGVGYEDWRHWLPCDSAWAVPCEGDGNPIPYTRSTAQAAGWQWRIPLQHRIGNGHVFSSRFMDDADARTILLRNLDGAPLSDPKLLRFTTGKRDKFWHRNCVALGLASGFMEPLESTSIHLVQSAIARLLSLFPNRNFDRVDIDEYNRLTHFEMDRIRDFLILHYCATERDDSEFWNYCRTMEIPDTLAQKIEQFRANGRIVRANSELFNELSWMEVMLGQGVIPRGYHPLVDAMPEEMFVGRMREIKSVIERSVEAMPSHKAFIASHCA
ncbi:tryptophan halogenase family protein [Microbulbifer harenosus]|uniref:Tryptophan 7-halogenase n=1 Tax=Microbulbifer harenosus TaxID=2576840 RepID=A0ABY2UEB8_9GAMM|nr:tryptophan halogenase family protein [Microbulbifer harenosus]TLM75206.1 tryptophan 7-halogenase [Microbulbifer harenosus]